MAFLNRKSAFTGLSALALSVVAGAAWADPLPGLVNQDFTSYTGSAPKGPFTSVNPVGWTGGNGLIFIDGQDFPNSAAGPIYLTTYGNPVGSVKGNYVEADGNPTFESGFNYTVTGLTVGKTYSLSFYQGASTQTGFGYNPITNSNSPTTNQWIVSLGTQGLSINYNAGPYDPIYGQTSLYYNNDPNASIAASPLMTVPYQGTVGWNYVSVNLTADATTDVLSFLAWGDNGSTVNLPPIAFLSGVDSPPGLGSGVPEPSTWAMMGLGFIGLGLMAQRRRAKSPETAQA
ncbi:PEP-CTERM sorting domain-containing protein [uncultured Rhodoblastus sp.]|uniref:PEP-CTERM sorting domain-containing protein n=1 Tax=uncultured Rhodoblastus sp. TaxID=543037 RepID=UPI0025FB99BE|nr:PEP-CTERM sorting domain-containing protein [uncultured Rhodoblastus sp.]